MNRLPRWSLRGEPVALAKYVNPAAVAALVRLPGASSAGRTDRLREVYRALAGVGIGYAFEAPSDERGRQVILTPREVLWSPRHGTCLDLAVVLAAACMTAGLHPVVVLLRPADGDAGTASTGHALVAVRMTGEAPAGTPDDPVWPRLPAGFARSVQRTAAGPPGAYVVLDPVGVARPLRSTPTDGLGAGFEEAVARGARYVSDENWVWHTAIDVGSAWRERDQYPLLESSDAVLHRPPQAAVGSPSARPRARALAGPPDKALDDIAAALAEAVRAQWESEQLRHRSHDPFPLPVHWDNAPSELMDQGSNIQNLRQSEHAPMVLGGDLRVIADIYDQVPSGRLVVLGQAGAGKTVLATEFVLTLLDPARWRRRMPVPVLLSLLSWDPSLGTSFHRWLGRQLLSTYPGLQHAEKQRPGTVARLLTTRRVLPVLDDFDGLAPGLRAEAVRKINASLTQSEGYLLLSRPGEYRTAVTESRPLKKAFAVCLEDLTVRDYADYLPLSATPEAGGTRTAWDAVVDRLERDTTAPEAEALRAAFTTPLAVSLARRVYSDGDAGSAKDPAELLEPGRFATRECVEEYLLGEFVEAAYAPGPDDFPRPAPWVRRSPRGRHSAEQARKWLGYLARDMDARGTRGVAWWEQNLALPPLFFMAAGTLLTVLTLGGSALLAAPFGIRPHYSVLAMLPLPAVLYLLHYPLARRTSTMFPRTVTVRRTAAARRRLLLRSLLSGTVLALVMPPCFVLLFRYTGGVRIGWPTACVLGFGAGVWSFGKAWVDNGMELVDLTRAPNPLHLLENARWGLLRTLTTTWLALFLCAGALVIGLRQHGGTTPLAVVPLMVLWLAFVTVAIAFLSGPWGFFTQTRVWLAVSGRLPLRLMTFLDDAHLRGILRQNGAVYEFRHVLLQRHLAGRRANPPPTAGRSAAQDPSPEVPREPAP
ncbi:NACHT domain-containing protein [Streptomyces xanthochromogenes]|uniref:NACHT domain-containing protein n=1 Tax=Streptomyces xanthochromogenes TaxID=67384 RepID=UPI0037FD09F6